MIEGSTQQHSALAVALAKLSVAYYRNGDTETSERVANKLLQLEKIPQWDGKISCYRFIACQSLQFACTYINMHELNCKGGTFYWEVTEIFVGNYNSKRCYWDRTSQ